jgi:CRISPR-associated endonuclease/helicase Cas3
LAHDLGKFVEYFQKKLDSKVPVADPIRHEWLSMLLLEALATGRSWPEAWAALERGRTRPGIVGNQALAEAGVLALPLADGWGVLLYLVATHHKLLAENGKGVLSTKNHVRTHPNSDYRDAPIAPVADALPEDLVKRLRRLVAKVQGLPKKPPAYWRAVAAMARMALILGDHSVSAEDHAGEPRHKGATAYANTSRTTKGPNQALDWHLPAVSEAAGRMVLNLARLELDGLSGQARSAISTEATGAYAWQERAALAVRAARAESAGPLLIYNMAGTGAGKTRMNLRAALESAGTGRSRVATALNLRTLTLQTYDAYLEQIGIPAQELACVIGDRTAAQFHQHAKQAPEPDFDGNDAEPEFDTVGSAFEPLPAWLDHFLHDNPQLKAVVSAPCVVSTVDFLAAAGDPSRQGHHALAMLRLMTSDLILDEIDSYDPKGLVAVLRLVQAAAFWGRNLVVSSATLSYPVAKAVWSAFNSGLLLRKELTGAEPSAARAVLIDDLVAPQVLPFEDLNDFYQGYRQHVHEMLAELAKAPRRRPMLVPVDPTQGVEGWHLAIWQSVEHLHGLNAILDPKTGKRVSVGLVRIANIAGAIPVARYLAKNLPAAKVACYHSRHFAVQRQHIEQRLDYLLNRKGGDPDGRLLRDPEIRALLDGTGADDVMLIVVATPVEEIGRDHDFDYAVIEPSSSQSIVQVCGRVLRHRLKTVTEHNVGILQFNRRAVLQWLAAAPARGVRPRTVFSQPGLESAHVPYETADMADLLNWPALDRIDASLRFGADQPFALLDDRSLDDSLARALPRVLGDEQGTDHLWMSENTYREWPLREQTTPSEDWAFEPDSAEYRRYEPEGKWGKPKWMDRSSNLASSRQRRPNDWLVLDLADLRVLAKDVDLTWDKAFAFKVTGEDKDFVVDWSFGIEAVAAAGR